MIIVHLIFSLNTGGAETMLIDILHHQTKKHRTHLVVINNAINHDLLQTVPPATEVHLIKRSPGSRSPLPLLRLNFLLRRIGTDVLHMHNVGALALFPKWFSGPWSKVVTIHGIGKPCANLKRYDRLFTISSAVQQDIKQRCDQDSVVIPNGINFKAITRKCDNKQTKTSVKIVQISRLMHKKKGQHLLIDALAILRKRHQINATVTFIGEGPSLKILQLQAKKLQIEQYCTFSGLWDRTQIYQELNTFDILVQPSLYEGFGLTVIEGIAAGLPVIASDGDGPAEILENGKYGWLFKNGDNKDLADQLHTVIEVLQNKDINVKLQQAYEYSKEKFDIALTADKYVQAYHNLQQVVSGNTDKV